MLDKETVEKALIRAFSTPDEHNLWWVALRGSSYHVRLVELMEQAGVKGVPGDCWMCALAQFVRIKLADKFGPLMVMAGERWLSIYDAKDYPSGKDFVDIRHPFYEFVKSFDEGNFTAINAKVCPHCKKSLSENDLVCQDEQAIPETHCTYCYEENK